MFADSTELLRQGSLKVGCGLSEEALGKFRVYLRELLKWNKRINLIGLKEEGEIIASLFVYSLACGLALSPFRPDSIVDIGSGAGFPGLPLKIAYPQVRLTLIEPNLKKAAFLHSIIGPLKLSDVFVWTKRVQEVATLPECQGCFDRALIKALRLSACLPYLKPLLRESGQVVWCKAKSAEKPQNFFGFSLIREIEYDLPCGFGSRVLAILASGDPESSTVPRGTIAL